MQACLNRLPCIMYESTTKGYASELVGTLKNYAIISFVVRIDIKGNICVDEYETQDVFENECMKEDNV